MIIFTAKQKRKSVKVGSYIPESDAVRLSKSIVNVQNQDERCLEYCILQHRYPNEIKNNRNSPNSYKKYFQFLKIPPNIQYPISIEDDIPEYERLNDVKIIVYKIQHEQFLVEYQSNYKCIEKERTLLGMKLLVFMLRLMVTLIVCNMHAIMDVVFIACNM